MKLKTVREIEFATGIAAILSLLLWLVTSAWIFGCVMGALLIGWTIFIFIFRKCPHCGKFLRNYIEYCPRCGKWLEWQ